LGSAFWMCEGHFGSVRYIFGFVRCILDV
jgi:hypothetical protein